MGAVAAPSCGPGCWKRQTAWWLVAGVAAIGVALVVDPWVAGRMGWVAGWVGRGRWWCCGLVGGGALGGVVGGVHCLRGGMAGAGVGVLSVRVSLWGLKRAMVIREEELKDEGGRTKDEKQGPHPG